MVTLTHHWIHVYNSNFSNEHGRMTYKKVSMRILILQPFEEVAPTIRKLSN
jgi:hypothetical protein